MKSNLLDKISKLEVDASSQLSAAHSLESVTALKIKFLGKKGLLTDVLKKMRELNSNDRPIIGEAANKFKSSLEEKIRELSLEFQKEKVAKKIESTVVDVTLPGRSYEVGHLHPLTQTFQEMKTIFTDLGFSIYEGPEIDSDYYSFEALNIPKGHPAREMQDTFYLRGNKEFLLRPHTSNVQIHLMETKKPPIRMIAPGAVYRRDNDVTHSPMFHQVEGLVVDESITFGDLKGVMTIFLHRMFGEEVGVRFRPSYFPFTEPSAEVDIECVFCKGKGCRICKETGWLEILGSGMVDPNVFESVGYDPETLSGFAFGVGVERVAMLKYGINDIRYFYENDLRFLKQF